MATTNYIITHSNDHEQGVGNGTPDHTAPIGSVYTDLDTGLMYHNVDGGTTWKCAKHIKTFWAYNMITQSGTFNGVVYTNTPSFTTLFDVHRFHAFDKNIEEAVSMAAKLPDWYIDGTDLLVTITHSDNTAGSGVRWMTGVRGKDGSDAFGQETDATYNETTITTTSGWIQENLTHTHSGTGYVAGEAVNIVVGRNSFGTGDDLNGDSYLYMVELSMA